jgi:hypothetical protein
MQRKIEYSIATLITGIWIELQWGNRPEFVGGYENAKRLMKEEKNKSK